MQEEPDGSGLYGGLDLVYEASGDRGKRLELLRRWRRDNPSSFSGDQATELASGLVEQGKDAEAITMLEEYVDRGLGPEGIEALWALYLGSKGADRAERFAEDLIASDDDYRAGLGHQLAARSALERGDFAGAERHYWKALEGTAPPPGAEVELLATIALAGDSARLEPAAQRICQKAKPAQDLDQVSACAAKLLTRAGQGEAASRFLEAQSSNLPSDLESLRSLASTAEAAGKSDVVERTRRRILELDPKDGNNWAGLGLFLEKQGRAEEVVDLLDRVARPVHTSTTRPGTGCRPGAHGGRRAEACHRDPARGPQHPTRDGGRRMGPGVDQQRAEGRLRGFREGNRERRIRFAAAAASQSPDVRASRCLGLGVRCRSAARR